MRPRSPTNSLIVTNVPPEILADPSQLAGFLAEANHPIELVALNKLERIIIICETSEVATQVKDLLRLSPQWGAMRSTYSIKNNELGDSWLGDSKKNTLPQLESMLFPSTGYLELPQDAHTRRFVISPPLSPPAEWDLWDKVEDGPNQKAVYSPQELSHLLWERLGGFDSSKVRPYRENEDDDSESGEVDIEGKSELLFENIENGSPAIVLDSVKHSGKGEQKTIAKTAMPPIE
ncbi:uncharacterized protein CANTADRAFT_3853 [Suhomyces tanzawaensis NRRL Y-17324]|uniref:Calcipressin n=1 Tax=Suhomyces tanzawaensis NRRL Y-17324 TaxID=984487 RepID=A0A1E4SQJ1_9ASCO|nr:uncharacterized protein CANTADRAFT_3853 [Suhomyces tanzawaensis NRRL Y-17324]ODV81780.1 hypothetical protein CANTADRAFT_3853 [Suhomyces tanzawaensis NRRL Y-17324]